MTPDTMRAEFEAKFAKPNEYILTPSGSGYQSPYTQAAWLAWQASAEACAKLADDLEAENAKYGYYRAYSLVASNIRALNHTAASDPNLVRAQHPDGVPCSCEQCTARRLAAQQET